MKPRWKEMLTFLNTALSAGLIFYIHRPDADAAIICSLAFFIATLLCFTCPFIFLTEKEIT
jgi:hypothetical protein